MNNFVVDVARMPPAEIYLINNRAVFVHTQHCGSADVVFVVRQYFRIKDWTHVNKFFIQWHLANPNLFFHKC